MRMQPVAARHAVGLGLGGHIHHVGLALGVEMGQWRRHGAATFSNMAVSS
jgi:putative effector of murein hydrolase